MLNQKVRARNPQLLIAEDRSGNAFGIPRTEQWPAASGMASGTSPNNG